jgi:lipopolysaccharide biosynthesis glycosyltransferase
MKNAVVTVCIGKEFEAIAKLTHPTIKAYADKIKADFIVIDSCKTTPHWEKFSIYDLLNKYDRIIYLDTDLIVREDCPNLFDEVPYNQLGAFNEARFVPREYVFLDTAKAYGIDPSRINWNNKYYNSGVMVISKCHKSIFKKPDLEVSNYYEQSYLNLKISSEESQKIKEDDSLMYDLSYKYNRMTCLDFSGEVRYSSYIIHYAGFHYFTSPAEIANIITKDIQKWKDDYPNYDYKRKIVIVASGGMGDQVDAEPAIRYIKKIYRDTAEILLTTHWPRLYEHLDFKIYKHEEFKPENFLPFYQMMTFPDPKTVTYSVVSNLLCHTVDYCSIAMLQRILPQPDKVIQLKKSEEDEKELDSMLDGFDLSKAVIIHPGRHWESKTFPVEWWQEVVDKVSLEAPVCLIGTDDHKNRGAFQLNLPENSISLIDRTNVGTLISVIARAPVLLSNDSVPVHIAGAFNNWIVLVPTCKHPDHVLPYRMTEQGIVSNYHRAFALYKKLTLDDCDQRPTTWIEGGATAESKKDPWEEYLPSVDEVCECVLKCWKLKG